MAMDVSADVEERIQREITRGRFPDANMERLGREADEMYRRRFGKESRVEA